MKSGLVKPIPWLFIVALAGCGAASGPPRYDVAGNVSFDGQPVQGGRVIFEPDAVQSNRGPAAYANIINGRYATDAGRGTVGGPLVVRISGFEGKSAGGEIPEGRQLFPEYRTKVELPRETAAHDFDIPPTQARQD